MSDQPWMKFYPRDWRGDQALRAVSIAARGLWMECLCIMHEAKPYGHLMLNGEPVEDHVLARMAGVSVDEVSALMAELRQAGVLSVTGRGVIFSRRMTKDHARARKGQKAAKKRWSQVSDGVEQSDAPNGLPNRKPTTQKPEARSQKKKEEPNGSSKKGSRIDPAWEPSEEEISFAEGRGLDLETINLEAEKFRNYWLGKAGQAGVKLDWPATWRNWIIKAVERRGESGLPPPGPRSSRYDAIRRRMNDPAMIPPNVAGGSR